MEGEKVERQQTAVQAHDVSPEIEIRFDLEPPDELSGHVSNR